MAKEQMNATVSKTEKETDKKCPSCGDVMEFRVTEVKEDGKLNLSSKQKAYLQIHEDADMVLGVIDEYAGVLPFDDKASPEIIKREFGLSKAAFKRAIGHLLKEGKVEIKDNKIRRR